MAHTHHHYWSLELSGIYRTLPPVHPQVCQAFTWINGQTECRQEQNLQWSFDKLKCLCTVAPILAYADFTRPFKLHTDACGSGLRTILYQTHNDGTDAVISYSSQNLTNARIHYSAHKLEFLTLKWAVIKKFHEYLYWSTFNVYTNNNPLIFIKDSKAGCHKSLMGG